MRLEFDEQGYVCCILYGCYTGTCSEYTGLVPTEPEAYEDIDDWANRAQTQAYKLDKNGNLIYDASRAASLPEEDAIEPLSSEYLRKLGIIDAIYPVGSLYMSVNDVSPEVLFGGTWEQIEDKFILSAGSTYSAGATGGAESYALSAKHKHTAPIGYTSSIFGMVKINGSEVSGSGKGYRSAGVDGSGTLSENIDLAYTSDTTISATIPTLPPYLAVFVWKRTA